MSRKWEMHKLTLAQLSRNFHLLSQKEIPNSIHSDQFQSQIHTGQYLITESLVLPRVAADTSQA